MEKRIFIWQIRKSRRVQYLIQFPLNIWDLLEGVDGELGHGMVDGVALRLADGLHAAGLVLNVHVVEGHVHDVQARERWDYDQQYQSIIPPPQAKVQSGDRPFMQNNPMQNL